MTLKQTILSQLSKGKPHIDIVNETGAAAAYVSQLAKRNGIEVVKKKSVRPKQHYSPTPAKAEFIGGAF